MGLQSRLLAGLAVLVFVAIASTGWLALEVARGRLEAAEEARARAMGESAAGVLGAMRDGLADPAGRARIKAAASALVGVGGIEDVTLVDAAGAAVLGDAGADAGFPAALAGAGTLARRSGGRLAVYAPVKQAGAGGAVTGALRLRMAVGETVDEAMRGATRLLLALTLVDGGLILLFGALFLRGVVRPLEALSQAAGKVAAGELDVPEVEASAGGEIGAMATAFNRMTAALREQKKRLESQQEQLLAQEKLATVGRLAAGVAHEVGNPLTAVLGYVEILLADEKDAGARELLGRIRGETGRIHRIVHDLLDYARPEPSAIEPVALDATVGAACDLLKPQPRFREIVVERALPADLPPAAASSRRLLQVVLNLLLNAADAMGGSGRVRITGRAFRENGVDVVILEIADDGPGVPASERARIFDPFYTTKEPGSGTGLGLAVCRSIVGAWGGTIELAPSEAGVRGATFRVTLPRWDRTPPRDSAKTELQTS